MVAVLLMDLSLTSLHLNHHCLSLTAGFAGRFLISVLQSNCASLSKGYHKIRLYLQVSSQYQAWCEGNPDMHQMGNLDWVSVTAALQE